MQSALILIAPAFLAASIYMTLGRIIEMLDAEANSMIPLKWLTKIFVTGDVLSFLMQASGKNSQHIVFPFLFNPNSTNISSRGRTHGSRHFKPINWRKHNHWRSLRTNYFLRLFRHQRCDLSNSSFKETYCPLHRIKLALAPPYDRALHCKYPYPDSVHRSCG